MGNKPLNSPPEKPFDRLTTRLRDYITNKLKDPNLKELLAGSSIYFIFKFLGLVSAYAFTLLITRNLGADAMGIYALSITVLLIFSGIGKLGFDTALLRFVAEYSAQNRRDLAKEVYAKAVKVVIPFSLLISVLLFIYSPHLAKHVFNKEYLSEYFRIASIAVLPMALIFINLGGLRGLKKIKEFSFLYNAAIYLFAIIILAFLLLFTKTNHIPLISYIISVTIVSVLSYTLWLRSSKFTTLPKKDSLKFRAILSVSLPMLLTGSLFLIMGWTDTIMLGMFRTESEVGIYNVALRVSTLISVSLFAINSIAAPKFAEFHGKGDIKGLQKTAQQSTKIIFLGSFPALLVLSLFPSFILGLFGQEFKSGVYALLFLSAGQFVFAICGSAGSILQMTGRQKIFQNIMLLATIINITLNIILIPRYGINGAAFASMTSMAFWNLCALVFVKYYLNITTVYFPLIRNKG